MTYRDNPGQDTKDCLSTRDAYLVMYYFVDAYWQRGGRTDGSVTLLVDALGPMSHPEDDDKVLTTDPAFWSDWLDAIETARSKGVPSTL